MSLRVSSIRNLGPASDAAFARAGIHSAEDLHKLGPDAAYHRLIVAGTRPHFIGYYALVMGLQGRPWNDCQGKEKSDLRSRFDEIKSTVGRQQPCDGQLPYALSDELDRIGVRAGEPKI
ncbi:MAG: TfoX/Sxy family protein [Boseongicola sp.]